MGDETDIKGATWKKVPDMGTDNRGHRENVTMSLKSMPINGRTTEIDVFEELLPVSVAEMLKIVRQQAAQVNDTDRREKQHVWTWLDLFLGASQFKHGTDLWSNQRFGMLAGPDFGKYMSIDKFRRVTRYLSRGPMEVDKDDPWCEIMYLLDGFGQPRGGRRAC